jgi:allophanate hydrolase subunit 1
MHPPPGWPRFTPVADHALLVAFGEVIGDDTSAAVMALDRALARSPCTGFIECVPAMVSLLVDFDPLLTDHAQVQSHVQAGQERHMVRWHMHIRQVMLGAQYRQRAAGSSCSCNCSCNAMQVGCWK